MFRPFHVCKRGGMWLLQRRDLGRTTIATFPTAGAAIDHAYRNWPWWP